LLGVASGFLRSDEFDRRIGYLDFVARPIDDECPVRPSDIRARSSINSRVFDRPWPGRFTHATQIAITRFFTSTKPVGSGIAETIDR
jgi:hypothetical protein